MQRHSQQRSLPRMASGPAGFVHSKTISLYKLTFAWKCLLFSNTIVLVFDIDFSPSNSNAHISTAFTDKSTYLGGIHELLSRVSSIYTRCFPLSLSLPIPTKPLRTSSYRSCICVVILVYLKLQRSPSPLVSPSESQSPTPPSWSVAITGVRFLLSFSLSPHTLTCFHLPLHLF